MSKRYDPGLLKLLAHNAQCFDVSAREMLVYADNSLIHTPAQRSLYADSVMCTQGHIIMVAIAEALNEELED